MKFRKAILPSGATLLIGKDAKSNDELMENYKGEPNKIFHTVKPGSPFCVIDSLLNLNHEDVTASGAICARYSQDWRDNKKDVEVSVFTGKDVYKEEYMPIGTFGVKKSKTIIVKKEEIQKIGK